LPQQELFVAQVLIKNAKLKCCGFLVIANKSRTTAFLCMDLTTFLFHPRLGIIERILFWNFLPEYLAIRTK
jgi:hypothetical protein